MWSLKIFTIHYFIVSLFRKNRCYQMKIVYFIEWIKISSPMPALFLYKFVYRCSFIYRKKKSQLPQIRNIWAQQNNQVCLQAYILIFSLFPTYSKQHWKYHFQNIYFLKKIFRGPTDGKAGYSRPVQTLCKIRSFFNSKISKS